jgi:tetratricopeptide (TPR) repeat protein
MPIPELNLHETRIPLNILTQLLHFSQDRHWKTKDFHQIAQELEEFIHSLPPSVLESTLTELWYLLIKLLFFAGDLKKLSETYTYIIAHNHNNVGVQIFYALGLVFQGYSEQASQILEQINSNQIEDPMLRLETMGIKLYYHSIKRAHQKVDDLFIQIIQLSQNLPELTESMKAHLLPWAYIRKAYSIRGETSQASSLLKKCQNELNIFPHRFFQALIALRLGHILHIKGDLRKALAFYDQAIDLANEIQSWHLLSIIYNRVGFVLTAQKQSTSAKEYFQDAVKLAEKAGARWLTVGPLANLVRWKLSQGKIQEAIDDYHTFASITKSVGDQQEHFYALLALAELYEQIEDIPKSKYYYSKGVSLGLKLGIFRLIVPPEDDIDSNKRVNN